MKIQLVIDDKSLKAGFKDFKNMIAKIVPKFINKKNSKSVK